MTDQPLPTSWSERAAKAARYLRSRDVSGLYGELLQFLEWQRLKGKAGNERDVVRAQPAARSRPPTETEYWDEFDKDLNRRLTWGSAGDFGPWALEKMVGRPANLMDLVYDMMKTAPAEPRRGLVLGCGDMVGEHGMFLDRRMPFAEIDAYDVSPASIEQARGLTEPKGLTVNYAVADVNRIQLPRDRYALIVVFHAYHHFEQVDHVAQQINQALAPGGVFYTMDYVGPRHLQYSQRQLFYAQHFLSLLPPEQRHQLDDSIREVVQSVPAESLSPDEAICSDEILEALDRRLDVRWQINFAGLLFPLLDGIAFNFSRSAADQDLMRFLFGVDYALCQSGEIEPAFTITLAGKRA